ncbi:hypothetical protein [Citrobacter portucalensis]|uniref:hypothetical protein n=1 Tax=Citrobacter portucalensis TaxID=1639133 RepID=UPI00351D0A87
MKTVDMLATYLDAWPSKYIRIFQGSDSIFYGEESIGESDFVITKAIPGEQLAGLMLSEDVGKCITCQEWVAARMSAMEKGDVPDISRAYVNKEKSDDDYMHEQLYNMKLQCLHAALIQNGQFDKTNATNIAEAINAGFDAINLGDCNIPDTNKALADSFEEVTRPVIKWLAQNVHPHHSVIIDSTHAELLEGRLAVSTEEYLQD